MVREYGDREDIAELERIQRLIEENNFATLRHSELDTAFHTVMYQRHITAMPSSSGGSIAKCCEP
jgi:DNA-binding GntR family transcriptional regulator